MKKFFTFYLFFLLPAMLFAQSVYTNVFVAKENIQKGALIDISKITPSAKKQLNTEILPEFKAIEYLIPKMKLFAAQDIEQGTLLTPQNTVYTEYKKPVLDKQVKYDSRLYALATKFPADQKIKTVDIFYKSDGQLKNLASEVKVLGKRRIKKDIVIYIQADPETIQKISAYNTQGTLTVKISQDQNDK